MTNIVAFKDKTVTEGDRYIILGVRTHFLDVVVFTSFTFLRGAALNLPASEGPQPSFGFADVVVSLDKNISKPDLTNCELSWLEDIDLEEMNEHIIKSYLKQAALKLSDPDYQIRF